MKKSAIWGVVILIIVAGASFWGGMTYAKGQTPARGSFTAGGAGFAGRTGADARGGAGGGFTTGQVISSGNGSITIQSAMSSSTEIVLIGDSTQILKTTAGTASDLTPGTSVVVTGTSNSDGSMTAQSIQVRPAGMNFPGGAGRGAGGQTSTQTQTTGQ